MSKIALYENKEVTLIFDERFPLEEQPYTQPVELARALDYSRSDHGVRYIFERNFNRLIKHLRLFPLSHGDTKEMDPQQELSVIINDIIHQKYILTKAGAYLFIGFSSQPKQKDFLEWLVDQQVTRETLEMELMTDEAKRDILNAQLLLNVTTRLHSIDGRVTNLEGDVAQLKLKEERLEIAETIKESAENSFDDLQLTEKQKWHISHICRQNVYRLCRVWNKTKEDGEFYNQCQMSAFGIFRDKFQIRSYQYLNRGSYELGVKYAIALGKLIDAKMIDPKTFYTIEQVDKMIQEKIGDFTLLKDDSRRLDKFM